MTTAITAVSRVPRSTSSIGASSCRPSAQQIQLCLGLGEAAARLVHNLGRCPVHERRVRELCLKPRHICLEHADLTCGRTCVGGGVGDHHLGVETTRNHDGWIEATPVALDNGRRDKSADQAADVLVDAPALAVTDGDANPVAGAAWNL